MNIISPKTRTIGLVVLAWFI